jgi:hypothetical protein
MIEHGIIDLEPWVLLRESKQSQRTQHINEVFPEWNITPFARRTDSDEVACWTGEKVVVIDDFDAVRDATGATVRHSITEYSSMDEWLIAATQDFIAFD